MSIDPKVQFLAGDNEPDWFESWFDSPYYHILYQHRDSAEAEAFLDNLVTQLQPAPGARILDVACGMGRHSLHLNRMGFDVTGYDLSSRSIMHNRKFEKPSLNFFIHDMREIFRRNYFDLVLNLFSSFGYFHDEKDNIRSLVSHATALKSDGIFVLDYFNAGKVKRDGGGKQIITIDGIAFHIEKIIDEPFIRKSISFKDKGRHFRFREELLLAGEKEMERYFRKAGLAIEGKYGNYSLDPFDEINSERLILTARKAN